MSKDKTHNQVRQILMNELGVTKELIRTQLEDIIKAVINQYLKERFHNIDSLISNQIKIVLKANTYDKDAIKRLVIEEAEKQVRDYVKECLTLNISIKPI